MRIQKLITLDLLPEDKDEIATVVGKDFSLQFSTMEDSGWLDEYLIDVAEMREFYAKNTWAFFFLQEETIIELLTALQEDPDYLWLI